MSPLLGLVNKASLANETTNDRIVSWRSSLLLAIEPPSDRSPKLPADDIEERAEVDKDDDPPSRSPLVPKTPKRTKFTFKRTISSPDLLALACEPSRTYQQPPTPPWLGSRRTTDLGAPAGIREPRCLVMTNWTPPFWVFEKFHGQKNVQDEFVKIEVKNQPGIPRYRVQHESLIPKGGW